MVREKERKRGRKKRKIEEKERNREKREKRREKERKKMPRVNYYQSAFNSQKEKLNILAEMLKI